MTAQKPEVIVERATPNDAHAVVKIQSQTWLDTYPNEKHGITADDIKANQGIGDAEATAARVAWWGKTITEQDDTRAVFVAKVDGKVVGFNSPYIGKDGRGRPAALYVLPEYHGLKIGAKLFQNSLDFLGDRDLYLHVASYNQKAIDFYQKFGFTYAGPIEVTSGVTALPSGASIPEIEMVKLRTVNTP